MRSPFISVNWRYATLLNALFYLDRFDVQVMTCWASEFNFSCHELRFHFAHPTRLSNTAPTTTAAATNSDQLHVFSSTFSWFQQLSGREPRQDAAGYSMLSWQRLHALRCNRQNKHTKVTNWSCAPLRLQKKDVTLGTKSRYFSHSQSNKKTFFFFLIKKSTGKQYNHKNKEKENN